LSIHFKTIGDRIIVFGQTFAHKEAIKGLGGRFNGVEKNWYLPATPANTQEVRALCEAAGGGELAPAPAADDTLPPWDTDSPVSGVSGSVAPLVTPLPSEESGMTVSQLMGQINQVVTRGFPAPVWIVGEIQNFAMRSHAYHFNLADAKDGAADVATVTIKAAAWPGSLTYMRDRHGAEKLKELFADGIKIRCLCRVTLYKDRGQVTLTLEDIDPAFTKGELALARERLLRELRAKGLDRTNKELMLSAFPFVIGLISAEGSRAESDFLHQLESGSYPGSIHYLSCKMQGDKVPAEVTTALRQLEALGVDAIVITRGGGSAADLRWFDAPEIAYAIAGCKVPVIAAIGHHDDVCVAEEICYQRQKTPTAAAQFFLDWISGTRDRINHLADRIADNVGLRLDTLQNRLERLNLSLVEQANLALHRENLKLTNLSHTVARSGETSLQKMRDALAALDKALTAADPTPWLAKGWTQLTLSSRGDAPLVLLEDVTVGDDVSARLIGGLLKLRVTDVKKKGPVQHGKKNQ